MSKAHQCLCGASLNLPEPLYGERSERQCETCSQWWAANGWHPIDAPRPAGDGPWFTIIGWPDLEGPYLLRFWYDVVEGRPALVGSELWGRSPVQQHWPLGELRPMAVTPLTSDATRLKVPELLKGRVEGERAMQRALLKVWSDAASAEPREYDARQGVAAAEKYGELRGVDEAPQRTGRPKTSPAVLRQVARIVRDAEMAGEPYAEKVATRFNIEESTARTWKRKAIKRGYLKLPGQADRPRTRGLVDKKED